MAAPWPHVHVSEREVAHTWPDGQKDDSHWEDCLWCSVVEWLNDTWKDVSDTLAYAEKLRDASGEPPTGGSNFGDVQRAFNKLGIPITLEPRTYSTFMEYRLKPGYAGVATGRMGNFPAGHRLRRWDTDFTGGHAVYIAMLADGTLWWCDPLAPKGTYQGEKITKTELKTFMGTTWTAVARPVRKKPVTTTPTGGDMPALTSYTPGATANVKPESNIRSAPTITTATKLRTTTAKEPVVLTGTVTGAKDPINGSTVWYTWWKNGRWEYTAKDNIVDLKPAVTMADVTKAKAEQAAANDAEVKALSGRITTIKGKVAANAADVAND